MLKTFENRKNSANGWKRHMMDIEIHYEKMKPVVSCKDMYIYIFLENSRYPWWYLCGVFISPLLLCSSTYSVHKSPQVVWKSEPNAQEHRTRDPTLTEKPTKCAMCCCVWRCFASLNMVRNVFFPCNWIWQPKTQQTCMYMYLQWKWWKMGFLVKWRLHVKLQDGCKTFVQ